MRFLLQQISQMSLVLGVHVCCTCVLFPIPLSRVFAPRCLGAFSSASVGGVLSFEKDFMAVAANTRGRCKLQDVRKVREDNDT